MLFLPLLFGCGKGDGDSSGKTDNESDWQPIPWTSTSPDLELELGAVRDYAFARSIVHLHSPYSHDACDGNGMPDGKVNEPCLADLRFALCEIHIDVAFVTDHPAHAAEQSYEDLFLQREDDELVDGIANIIHCDDGHEVTWLPGIEDELMPVGLTRHVAGTDAVENDRIYNNTDSEAFDEVIDAGAFVIQNHTEGKELTTLLERQDMGLGGVEIFNVHAMFAPDIREEDLGLDSFEWLTTIDPFIHPQAVAEPDLLFLGVLQEQDPSIEKWEALLARAPTVGVTGSDAHQNTIPLELRDGERGDSYRRVLKWFGTWLLADDVTPAAYDEALRAGRAHVVFEVLGTPDGADLFLTQDDGTLVEVGSDAETGVLSVTCPTLSTTSPRGEERPDVSVIVYKDGEPWQTECGDFDVTEPGVYRARFDIVPNHLRPFLGDDPDEWLVPYPWVYTNAIRVGL